MWLQFIEHFNGRCFFIHEPCVDSDYLELYTDASGLIGYEACYKRKWFYGSFPEKWHIIFYTDNEAFVYILNKKTTKIKNIMFLVRKLVLLCLQLNINFKSKHTEGKRKSRCSFSIAGRLFSRPFTSQRESTHDFAESAFASELLQRVSDLLGASLAPSSVQAYK